MSNLFFDALTAALDDMGARERRADKHRHKCPKCGNIWAHDRAEIMSADDPAEANERAHTCTQCGENSDGCYDRYHGSLPCSTARSVEAHPPTSH